MKPKQPGQKRIASIAAFDAEGKLLFGLRADNKKWTLPGGHIEEGEDPLDGARRELLEEAGLEGQDWQYLGRGVAGREDQLVVYCYRCRVDGKPDAAQDPDAEMESWRWVDGEVPSDIADNLAAKKNVTLRLLNLQDGEVEEPMAKADPHFVEYRPTRGEAIKIPKHGTKSRVQWDKDFLENLAHYFTGGDVTRLKPIEVPTTTRGSNMAVNKSRLKLYQRMVKAKDRLPPVVVRRNGIGHDLLDGNHRIEAARQAGLPTISAVEIQDPPLKKLKKGLATSMFLTGALAASQGAPQQPKPPQPQAQFQAPAVIQAWTPDGLHPDLHPIAHLESSWGKNISHSTNKKGEFHTAFGALGFKPVTAHEEYLKSNLMQQNYPDLQSVEKFLPTFKQDSKFYNLLASAHWARLKGKHGGPQQAAYAWRWGSGAAHKATPEQIKNDLYVQKYTHMNLHQKQGEPSIAPLEKSAKKPKPFVPSGRSASTGPRPKVVGAEHVRAALDELHTQIDHRYDHLNHNAVHGEGLDEDEIDSSDHSLLPSDCQQCQKFPIDQGEIGRCTSTAAHVAKKLGGKVYGYADSAKAGASLGEGPDGEGGHDFAVIGNRYIADWWANSYHDKPDLWDMQNPAHKQTIAKLYGDRRKWKLGYDFEANPHAPHHWESFEKTESWLLEKMAVGTIQPGAEVQEAPDEFRDREVGVFSPSHVDLSSHKVYDYSHHLTPEHRQKGYQLRVHDGFDNKGDRVLNARVLRYDPERRLREVVGEAESDLAGKDLRVDYTEVVPEHRQQGLGQKMYEALFAHGRHQHKVKTVSGGRHSTMARRVHEKLRDVHGFKYRAGERRPMGNGEEFDGKFGPYKYAIKSENEDASFDFGANDPAQDELHQKALKSIARMHPDNQKMAHAWIAFVRGHTDQRPHIYPDLERHLARFGIVDPQGFSYGEDGRSLERGIAGPRVSRDANGRRAAQPEGLRRHRQLDVDYFLPYQKSEQSDPLEAMLAHEDPRERIMAMRSKAVTPYHLRLALQDEDPDVRAAAAKHPMMTSALIEEALRHTDVHTREAALSRPDLQEHHLEQAIWDPELQTQAALHPALTEEQRQKLLGDQRTPEGLKSELLAKTIGYLLYPRLGVDKPDHAPFIRDPKLHDMLTEAADSKSNAGHVTYNSARNATLPGPKRKISASMRNDLKVRGARTALGYKVRENAGLAQGGGEFVGIHGHETQHGVFAGLKQRYGREAGYRIVATTLSALNPQEHQHLRDITDWMVDGHYDPIKQPEERIAYLQNYLQDGLWRKSAHKRMRIHMDAEACRRSEAVAKIIWQKLRTAAAGLGPEHIGVPAVVEKAEPDIRTWVLRQSESDLEYNVQEDQLGLTSRTESYLAAIKFLAHQDPDESVFRLALHGNNSLVDAALLSVGFPVTEENRRSLLAVIKLQTDTGKLQKAETAHEVLALMPDGHGSADAVRRGFGSNTEEQLHLNGKHSAGTLMVKDPDSGQIYLLKPGSGGQSPASGARQEQANQSRREAAFWHVAEAWGLEQRVPRADLLLVDGREIAALHMLPFDWKNLDKLKTKDVGLPHKALEKYLRSGELHKWAILDAVTGNPDRHGQNLMVGPQKDGYPVGLIDHGSAFAGPDFDPAHDRNSFIPYYLRAWVGDSWARLSVDQKFRSMPVISGDTEKQLRAWFDGIHADDLEQILHRFGINPEPSLARLAAFKQMLDQPNFSEAINRYWVTE